MRCLLALSAVLLVAADWPQWLGPNRDNSSAEVVKPWSGEPKALWRVPVGAGHAGPIVVGGKVYLHHKVEGQDAEKLSTFDAATGREVGSAVHARKPFSSEFGVGPRATPVVAPDGQIITFGVTGNLAAQPAGSGKAWNAGTAEQFNAPKLKFGVSGSPLVDGDLVIVPVGGKGASLVAFNRQTGQVAWKALDDAASYAAPVVIEAAGRRQLVALTAANVVALDPATGALLWKHPFRDLLAESSTTPIKVGELLIASSVTLGSIGLKLTTKDGQPAVEPVWKNAAIPCYFSTPVAVGDSLYMVTGSLQAAMARMPRADLCCVETATGKVRWKRENVGKYHASLLRTGDGKLLMLGDDGALVLIDPSDAGYRELVRAKACGPTWAHPALSDGRLYVRDDKELICLPLN